MNPRECGYLLLSSKLGNPDRRPLSTAQLRLLAQRAAYLPENRDTQELTMAHLLSLGLERQLAERVLHLLEDTLLLEAYLSKAKRLGCTAITRVTDTYPAALRQRLGLDAPGCLWAKGNCDILRMPAVSLVGSRDLQDENRKFARPNLERKVFQHLDRFAVCTDVFFVNFFKLYYFHNIRPLRKSS